MNKKTKTLLTILTALALFNVIVIPIFDVWGGLFPSDVQNNFFQVIEYIFEDADNWNLWVVRITISIFLPTVIMFIMALVGEKGLFITFNVIGIVIWFAHMIQFGIENEGLDEFNFKDGCISIGTWIAIIIFFATLIIVLNSKKETNTVVNQISTTPQFHSQSITKMSFCKVCGAPNEIGVKFCGACGASISILNNDDSTPISSNEYAGQVSKTISFCPNCESNTENNSYFCGKCGCKL